MRQNEWCRCQRCGLWWPLQTFKIIKSAAYREKYHPFGHICEACFDALVKEVLERKLRRLKAKKVELSDNKVRRLYKLLRERLDGTGARFIR